jgi:hypothetical protein
MTITLKAIDTRIGDVKRLGTEYNQFIHETAMMIIRHAAPKEINEDCQGSGDCTRAVKLVRAMPASMRRTTLIAWFAKYTPIRIKLSDNGDKCEFDPKYKKLAKADKLEFWDVIGAAEEPFYDVAEATPEEKTYDFLALMKMVERLSKQIEKKIEDGAVPEADVESAKAIARAVSGLKVERVVVRPPLGSKVEIPSNDTEVGAAPVKELEAA